MDRYQVFTRILLNNWHYINRKILSFHSDINFFTGHSGSGKSTVLDALQLVLYADTNGRNFFNKAAKEDSDRTLIEYLRGMKNVQDNGVASYLRNNNFSSTIVLEFQDTETKEYQCVGVSFDVDTATNDINRLFFRHTGRILENEYRMEDRTLTTTEVRDYLKNNFSKDEIYYGRTNEAFRSKLYDDYFGGLDEKKFVSLFKRAIPFRMDMKLEDFVKEYICVEQDIHMENMQDSVTQYIRLKRRLEEIRMEIEGLQKIEDQYQIFHAVEEEREQALYYEKRLELLYLEQETALRVEKQKVLKEECVLLQEKKERLEEERKALGLERDQVIIAIENSGYEHLEKEIQSLERLYGQYERDKKLWDKIAQGLNEWKDEFVFDTEFEEAQEQFSAYQIKEEGISLLQKKILEKRKSVEEERQKAKEKENTFLSKISQAEKEKDSLKKGQKVYPWYITEAKKQLEEKLQSVYGKKISVEVLADLIEVRDDTWRNAVEGYMGRNKLALIVPPEYVSVAMKAYRNLDAERFYHVAVVDTEKIMEHQKPALKGALSEEVESEQDYVKAYITYLMGNTIKCESIEELSSHRSAITKDCMLYQGYRLQHINPKNYREQAYIGINAMEQKLTLLEKSIAAWKKEKEPYAIKVANCNRILLLEKLEQSTEHYMELLSTIGQMQPMQEEMQKLSERIEDLKEKDIDEWKAKKELLDRTILSKDQEKDEASEQLAKDEAMLNRILEESVSLQERLIEKKKEFVENQKYKKAFDDEAFIENGENLQKLKNHYMEVFEQLEKKEEETYQKLTAYREEYQRNYSYRGFSISSKDNSDYTKLLNTLRSEKLEEFMVRANEQAKVAVDHFKTDFIYKIRDAIKEAMQQKDDLNQVLSKLDFGKDKYRFVITKSRGEEGKFYDMFMDENLEINPASLGDQNENQMNLFSMEHENKYADYMNELLDLFMPPETSDAKALEEARANLERYADYRTYLSFDMEQRVEGMPVMRLSKMLSKNSGGEGQNPLYVALLASFAQIYRIHGGAVSKRRPTLRLVVLDEAFSKMDGEKVGSCIGLIRRLGVQAIISATNDKIQNYVDNVDKTFVFANPNKTNISIQEFERQEFDQI